MQRLLKKVRGAKGDFTEKTPKFSMSVRKKGFSLVELLVVIVIIGLLFMVFVPRIDFASNNARETGVKSDFRSFSLAAEQLLRENAGISKHNDLSDLCASGQGLNQYLDHELHFDVSGESLQSDPWNQKYEIQLVLDTGVDANPNNGAIMFISGGKDGAIDGNNDYVIAVSFADGVISSETSGFSSNIESAGIDDISDDSTAASYTLSGDTVTLKYKR